MRKQYCKTHNIYYEDDPEHFYVHKRNKTKSLKYLCREKHLNSCRKNRFPQKYHTEYMREYRKQNRDRMNARVRELYKQNPEKYKLLAKAKANRNKHTVAMRRMLSNFLVNANLCKSDYTSNVLGYTFSQFKQRIETNFKPGMTWENHGEWHIDHKIPVSHFLAKGQKNPKVVNALCNLQPLWKEENLLKGDKFIYDFASLHVCDAT